MNDVELLADMLNKDEPQLKSWPPCIQRMLPVGSKILLPDNTELPVSKAGLHLIMEAVLEDVTLTLPEHPFAFSIRNIISGIEKVIPASEVPVTGPRKVQPGGFYINMMGQCYYCEKIENDLMTLTLLEDEQHGTTISATMTQELRYSSFYFPIDDPHLIDKLKAVLDKLKNSDRVARENSKGPSTGSG